MIIDYCAHCGDADVLRRAYNEMNRGYFEQDQVLKLARDAGIGVSVAAGGAQSQRRVDQLCDAGRVW